MHSLIKRLGWVLAAFALASAAAAPAQNLNLSPRVGSLGQAAAAPSTLSLPFDGIYIPEGSPAGTRVATPTGLARGTTRSIASVKNSSGSTVASTIFAFSGNNLVAGSTPAAASDVWYEVSVAESGRGTITTPLYVYVVAKPSYLTTFTDDFTGTAGDLIRNRTGWTGSGANVTTNGTQLSTLAGTGSVAVHDVGSLNQYVKLDLAQIATANTALIYLRYTDSTNYVAASIIATDTTTNGATLNIVKRHAGYSATNAGANVFIGNHNSTTATLEIRIIDDQVYAYAGGVLKAGPYDVSIVPPSGKVGLGSGSTASLWDNFEAGQYGDFAAMPASIPVYAVDQVALKAQVPVRVAWTGTTPTALEYRIETAAGAAVSGYDWASFTESVIGASGIAGRVVAPVGTLAGTKAMWRWAVRDANNTARVARSSLFGVGDVVAFLGQSNNQRMFSNYASAVDSFDGYAFGTDVYGATVPKFIPLIAIDSFANTLIPLTNRPVMVVNLSYPGVDSATLKPGSANYIAGQGWLRLYAPRLNALLIQHGETDTENSTQAAWVTNWPGTINGYLATTSQRVADVKIGVGLTYGESGPFTRQGSTVSTNYLGQRKLEAALAASFATGYVSHHRYDTDYAAGDYIHTSNAEYYAKVAPRWALGYAKAIGVSAYDRLGPYVSAISRTNAVISATVNLNGASSLTDSTGTNSGTLAAGWQVVAAPGYNGSQNPDSYFSTPTLTPPLAITSVTYTGTTVTITLTSNPGGPVAVRYMAATSCATTCVASVFDGSEPFGLPYLNSTGGQAAAAQIKGVYAEQNVGLAPMINAMATP